MRQRRTRIDDPRAGRPRCVRSQSFIQAPQQTWSRKFAERKAPTVWLDVGLISPTGTRSRAGSGDYQAIAKAVRQRHRPDTLTPVVLNTVDLARQRREGEWLWPSS